MKRIDTYPTHEYEGYKISQGKPFPFGATMVPGGVNFSIYSSNATACTLVLYEIGANEPMVEIPILEEFHIGNVFCMTVYDIDPDTIEYGYRFDGPWEPEKGHRFDDSIVLLDPYAKLIGGRDVWRQPIDVNNPYPFRSRVLRADFDWAGDRRLHTPIEDLVIYEMHVRGFTQHPSSEADNPGTYAAIREKIPYLKDLGVNCVELMPVFEFDELEYPRDNPLNGDQLINFWGYSTLGFFAPKAGFAASGRYGMQSDEFKAMVKALHANGIEVFLDVVFNHTNEGNDEGPTTSFRGIDNAVYYLLDEDGDYLNFSGTGNTMNCNHPVVRELVIDCLRYWVAEYHIDGFRFDLASVLGRDQEGEPLSNPPLLEALALDPLLAHCKLIAEAWDAGGLYQVGTFPAYGRWAEWNGKYRDAIRRWVKSDQGIVREVGQRIIGSPDLYGTRGSTASINFITCHDGFTLHDLFAYNEKHNLANGEDNLDGANDNYSWNCGVEGPTDDPEIAALRERLMRNAITILMVSQGVPMFFMGDEYGHTKFGNNNTYCHDNELNYFDWEKLKESADLYRFFKQVIAFRKAHPVLRVRRHLAGEDYVGSGCPDLTWHGVRPWDADWSGWNLALAFMLCGENAARRDALRDVVYVMMNMYWEPQVFELPAPTRNGVRWHVAINTGNDSPDDICPVGQEPLLEDQRSIQLAARSVVVLVGKAE
ncbi:MAG: glycogen debranching protein GlgX [Anaerolineae bacterium]|nr:glycogen debranching protein GlgX [Anaerolineae bacterium]